MTIKIQTLIVVGGVFLALAYFNEKSKPKIWSE